MKYWATAVLALPMMVQAQSYVGVGMVSSQFHAPEFDRYYESDSNSLKQIKFGYNNKKYIELFGNVGLDTDNEVQDWAIGLLLEDTIIKMEAGKISGRILEEDTDALLGTFDSEYKRIDVLSAETDGMGFALGVGYQEYNVPHLFKYGGDSGTLYLQDDDVSIQSLGFGVHYDPVANFVRKGYDLMYGSLSFKNDWYLSSSTLALSVAQITTSDAPELVAQGQGNQSKWMVGNQGTYELGWMIGKYTPDYSFAVNAGYLIKANIFFGDSGVGDPKQGEFVFDAPITIIHGPVVAVSATF